MTTVRIEGPPMAARMIVSMLETEGEVRLPMGFEWPMEQRGAGPTDAHTLVLAVEAMAGYDVVKAVVRKAVERWGPSVRVFVEEQRQFHRDEGDGL